MLQVATIPSAPTAASATPPVRRPSAGLPPELSAGGGAYVRGGGRIPFHVIIAAILLLASISR